MRSFFLLLLIVLCGCAGGPTHDYYSPAVVGGTRFKGPITMSLVDDVNVEKEKCLAAGYVLIGTSDYTGKYPEAAELKAQAHRAYANHVIYSVKDVSKPGSWHFSISNWGGGGGSSSENETHIVFMGK
ncbi:MAG TPA: hypothetical protein VGI88_15390 [Verrucomicrobiae bacterium]|jgi:hypothetical protein